jgi:hypothetical protein
MHVALRWRGACACASPSARPQWPNHYRFWIACRDLSLDVVPIVSVLAGEGHPGTLNPVEQRTDLHAVIGLPVRQHRGNDLAPVSLDSELEQLPDPPALGAMPLFQPSAGTVVGARNLRNGRTLDVSQGMARRLNIERQGTARWRCSHSAGHTAALGTDTTLGRPAADAPA